MPRSYYTPERGRSGSWGHWEMRVEDAKAVDVWVSHCERHPTQEEPCDLCVVEVSR